MSKDEKEEERENAPIVFLQALLVLAVVFGLIYGWRLLYHAELTKLTGG